VGWITSTVYSPARQRNIALGYVRREVLTPGTPLQVRTQDNTIDATVAELPFYKSA
jgi:glycine cleavage system aminomethyltransferase T